MSEYQYYEFQAIDRPLTSQEIAELRARSSRASITPTRFQNVYHWGDLKGQPLDWVERYFDVFVYVANWGTNRFMVKLPCRLFDPNAAHSYFMEESLDLHRRGDSVILEFVSHDDDGGYWIEDEDAASWMPALLPLRAEIAAGDPRALYLAWLAGIAPGAGFASEDDGLEDDDWNDELAGEDEDDIDDETIEPPLPPGLGQRSAALDSLAAFLRIDEDLLAVAAMGSPALPDAPAADDLRRWLSALPATEKDAVLLQLMDAPEHARAEVMQRFRQENAPPPEASPGGRTVGSLRAAAAERRSERRRREAERQAEERARQERKAAMARATYLESLAGHEDDLWRQVDTLIAAKQPKQYDRAVVVLTDLHDLSVRQDDERTFTERLDALRERNAKRPALLVRLDGAELHA